MDNVLLRTIRIITINRSAEFSESTYQLIGIGSFKFFRTLSYVSHIFHIVLDNSINFYLNTALASKNATHCARNITHYKIVPIKIKRAADEHCFQVAAIRD